VADQWRTEADAEWLAAHSSDTFGRLRRRFGKLARFSGAISNAELGPLGGAPRRPRLKIGGRSYSYVRYVESHIAHTTVLVDLGQCRRCGRRLTESHGVTSVDEDGVRVVVGAARACRQCQIGSWLFYSRMPAVARARRYERKVVL
jgi:DNA-directed RNA polymerase subunit N (RpoN/RPB10)